VILANIFPRNLNFVTGEDKIVEKGREEQIC